MKKLFFYILTYIIIGCNDNNDTSKIPFISHESISFKKSENNITQDSLILTINFIDGDGNLGLSNDEINYPYHPYNAIIDENLNWVTIGSEDITPPLYVYEPNGVLSLYSENDNRPSFNCDSYIINYLK